jgi:hypothetical protein
MALKIHNEMIAQIEQAMHRSAAINAEQVAAKFDARWRTIFGAICTSLYLLTVLAAVFAISPILLS